MARWATARTCRSPLGTGARARRGSRMDRTRSIRWWWPATTSWGGSTSSSRLGAAPGRALRQPGERLGVARRPAPAGPDLRLGDDPDGGDERLGKPGLHLIQGALQRADAVVSSSDARGRLAKVHQLGEGDPHGLGDHLQGLEAGAAIAP